MAADWEIDAGVEDGDMIPAVPRKQARKGNRLTKKTPSRLCARGSEDDGDGEGPQCYLCERPPKPDDPLSKEIGGMQFHHQCWLGIRCRQRLTRNSAEARKKDSFDMAANPAAWRSRVMSLVKTPGNKTRTLARIVQAGEIEKHFRSDSKFNEASNINDDILLTRTRYINYMRREEGMDEASARRKFRKLLVTQQRKYCNGKKEMVRIADNPRIRSARGSRRETGTKTERMDEEDVEDTVSSDSEDSSADDMSIAASTNAKGPCDKSMFGAPPPRPPEAKFALCFFGL